MKKNIERFGGGLSLPKSEVQLSSGLRSAVKEWAATQQGLGLEDLWRGLNKTVIESMLEAELKIEIHRLKRRQRFLPPQQLLNGNYGI